MEAPRRPRLRLSRRRLPSGDGPPRPRPRSPQDGDGDGDSDGAGERARLWAELLRAVSADLGAAELPPLPAFPAAEPGPDPARAASPEVFTVGSETFSWTPFPPAPRGGQGPGCSYRVPPAPSPLGCPPPEPREVPADPPVPERLAGGGAQALQSCPLCQADFAPGLTQLDIDSHLAQCLADSTEDVVW